jgi:hypothetical protein
MFGYACDELDLEIDTGGPVNADCDPVEIKWRAVKPVLVWGLLPREPGPSLSDCHAGRHLHIKEVIMASTALAAPIRRGAG